MFEEIIKQLGYNLPEAPKPVAAYIPVIRSGNLVFTAGQMPILNGELKFLGKLGKELSIETGQEAARLTALNCLSVIKSAVGNLDNIARIIKLTVFVNSTDDFKDQPKVANGASEFVVQVFGEAGKHVRSAVGVNSLPLGVPVETEMIVELK
jgi:enamine deaminase RidA (YjgF/YER057c/UK114 family)